MLSSIFIYEYGAGLCPISYSYRQEYISPRILWTESIAVETLLTLGPSVARVSFHCMSWLRGTFYRWTGVNCIVPDCALRHQPALL